MSAILHNTVAQTSYSSYNAALIDSLVRSLDGVCTAMESSKRVTKKGIRQDKKRIQFLNEFYNQDLPIEDIRQNLNRVFNFYWDFKTQNLGQVIKYETSVPSSGNLDMKISFSTYRNEIVFKHFDITTSTLSDCIEPNYFYGISPIDLKYLKENIITGADFPMHTLKSNGKIICDTVYFSKLKNSTDSTFFRLNNSFPKKITMLTLFGLDIYRSHQTDPDILGLVNDQDINMLIALMDSPNFYVAIHAMEALKYLGAEEKVDIIPEIAAKMNLIETADFPLNWQYSDVVKRGVRYKDLNVGISLIKEKYKKGLVELNSSLLNL